MVSTAGGCFSVGGYTTLCGGGGHFDLKEGV